MTNHVSIHTLHLDGLRELYRHFLCLEDGSIIEVQNYTLLLLVTANRRVHTLPQRRRVLAMIGICSRSNLPLRLNFDKHSIIGLY